MAKEIIRIISAREANQRERRIYIQQPVNKRQEAVLARIAKRQAAGDDSRVPPLSDEQLAQFRRAAPKALVASRLDQDVYDWLMRYGEGYSTRINSILRAVMSRAR
jgi:uncharacterized protein (DUF4415 family)